MIKNNSTSSHQNRRKDDILLKAAFEELFPHLLRFFFKDSDKIFDLRRKIVFLNKELSELFPELQKRGGTRFVDMLAKIFLKDGREEWVLIHIEIQGGNTRDFPIRMFRYWYRIYDRYSVSITALAIFTGNKYQKKLSQFHTAYLGTELTYNYNTYHILDHTAEELMAMENPFALIILAARQALLQNKVPEEEFANSRFTIARALIQSKKLNHSKIAKLLFFLKNFLYIGNDEINRKFDEDVHQLSGKKISMGIIETIKQIELQKGIKKGIEKGMEKKNLEFVKSLLLNTDFNIKKIAGLANVGEGYVKKVKDTLRKKSR